MSKDKSHNQGRKGGRFSEQHPELANLHDLFMDAQSLISEGQSKINRGQRLMAILSGRLDSGRSGGQVININANSVNVRQ